MGVTEWRLARAQGKQYRPSVHVGRSRFDSTYELGKTIGRGSFGEVHSAVHVASGVRVAVKIVKLPEDTRGAARNAYAQAARREIETLCRLSHPHIVSVIEAFIPSDEDGKLGGPTPTWLTVLELCEGCDLQTALDSHGALPVDVVRSIAAQLASAVEHMHAHGGVSFCALHAPHGWSVLLTAARPHVVALPCPALPPAVVHRDLTPANIIVLGSDVSGASVEIKVLDFGLAHGLDAEFVRLYTNALMRRMSARHTPVVPRNGWATVLLGSLGMRTVARDRSGGPSSNAMWVSTSTSSPNDNEATSFKKKGREWVASEVPPTDADTEQTPRAVVTTMPPPPMREPSLKEQASHYSFTVEPAKRFPMYTAPEIMDHHRFRVVDSRSSSEFGIVVDATVVVDAYSVGAVLKHLLTGVPPDRKVAEFIAQKTAHPVSMLLRVARACVGRPVPFYRYMAELHDVDGTDVCQLLHQLMERDPAKRMTISELNEHPWIANADVASLREFKLSGHV